MKLSPPSWGTNWGWTARKTVLLNLTVRVKAHVRNAEVAVGHTIEIKVRNLGSRSVNWSLATTGQEQQFGRCN